MDTPAVEKLKALSQKYPPFVQELSKIVLNHPKFNVWTGSGFEFVHHYGYGQLAQHTLEVVELALLNNKYFESIGKGVPEIRLFLAALYHDFGKIYDYQPEGGGCCVDERTRWENNKKHKDRIYHISKSAIAWSKAYDDVLQADKWNLELATEDFHDDVLHAILAHHGRYEWKSPATPRTRIAWLLHLSDSLSARVDDCEKERPNDYKK